MLTIDSSFVCDRVYTNISVYARLDNEKCSLKTDSLVAVLLHRKKRFPGAGPRCIYFNGGYSPVTMPCLYLYEYSVRDFDVFCETQVNLFCYSTKKD